MICPKCGRVRPEACGCEPTVPQLADSLSLLQLVVTLCRLASLGLLVYVLVEVLL